MKPIHQKAKQREKLSNCTSNAAKAFHKELLAGHIVLLQCSAGNF